MTKIMENMDMSFSKLVWKKFKKEKIAVFSLLYVLIVVIISILGYLITPDNSPDCNHQQIEIALQKRGFTVKLLQIKRPQKIEKVSFFTKMLFGQPELYTTIPIDSYEEYGDSVKVFLFSHASGDPCFAYPKSELADDNPVIVKKFLLGTDRYGRDVLSQLLIGSRVSLSVGFVSVLIALLIGVLFGAIAGFYRGKIDDILMFLLNVVWSIPTLLLVIAISFALGKGFWQIFIALGLTMWIDVARVVRGQVISIREKEFVEAGKALGFSDLRIILKHILPNITNHVTVIAASNFSSAILMEAGLSFLGLGIQPPTPSWGMMMKENYAYIILDHAYLAIAPGIVIMLLVLSFMLIANALRKSMDVREN